MIEKIKARIKWLIEGGIWTLDLGKMPVWQSFLIKTLRVLVIAIQGVKTNNITIRASSLTFFSLLSIVPVLALLFGIAKGFDLDKEFEELLIDQFAGQEAVLEQSLTFAEKFIKTAKGGIVAGIGFVVLFYSVLRLMTNIEMSFNKIWGVRKDRTLVRKFTDYISIIILGPILVVLANSLTVYFTTVVQDIINNSTVLGWFKDILFPILRLIPIFIIWLLFILLYITMPNTYVSPKAAIIGGIIGGSIFELLQFGLVNLQIGVSRYNAIYGSFSALPLFLIWLQASWTIVLLGAELTRAVQNIGNYEAKKPDDEGYSIHFRKQLAINIIYLIVQRFTKGETPYNIVDLANELKLPSRMIQQTVEDLKLAELINESIADDAEGTRNINYIPAKDPGLFSVAYVLKSLENAGYSDTSIFHSQVKDDLLRITNGMFDPSQYEGGQVLLKDLKTS